MARGRTNCAQGPGQATHPRAISPTPHRTPPRCKSAVAQAGTCSSHHRRSAPPTRPQRQRPGSHAVSQPDTHPPAGRLKRQLEEALADVVSLNHLLGVSTSANSLSAPRGGLVMRHDQGGSLIRMWADAPLAIRKAGDVPRCARGFDSLLIDAATCPVSVHRFARAAACGVYRTKV